MLIDNSTEPLSKAIVTDLNKLKKCRMGQTHLNNNTWLKRSRALLDFLKRFLWVCEKRGFFWGGIRKKTTVSGVMEIYPE